MPGADGIRKDGAVTTSARPAAGGGRWVDVPPERLSRWIDGFADRHGPITAEAGETLVTVTAADGAVAHLHLPFPPLAVEGPALSSLIAHARRDRRVGVLLVRLGGYAAGIFEGERLVSSKVDTKLVHGRHKKGGSSQQRFARRREGEVRRLLDGAADVAARVLVPAAASLEAVVLGGDRRAVDQVLADRRLEPLVARVAGPFLTVPDPRQDVLLGTPAAFRAVRIHLTD